MLNLVPNKTRAFAEILRVLRPAAHFCVSDLVATGELSEPIRHAASLYVGCIAGALPREHYLRLIEEAGFEDVEVAETKPIELPDDVLHRHIDEVTNRRVPRVRRQPAKHHGAREKTGTRKCLTDRCGRREPQTRKFICPSRRRKRNLPQWQFQLLRDANRVRTFT